MFGWGISDFFANQASDSVGHRQTFFWSQIAGLILIVLTAVIMGANFIISPHLAPYILLAGIGYALGYLLFYKGFEIGNVSVVSAAINLQQIFVIGISYFVFRQKLGAIQIPAIVLLILGVILVSVDFSGIKMKGVTLVSGVKETLLSAVFFGIIFWPLNEYIVERTDWISATFYIKLTAILTVLIIARVFNHELKLKSKAGNIVKVLISVGLLEAFAVISVSYGQTYGDSIIISPIASALTVVTVGLAMVFLKEKITKYQGFGILLTIIGIIMMGL